MGIEAVVIDQNTTIRSLKNGMMLADVVYR
jgi:L-arabinose isomerase